MKVYVAGPIHGSGELMANIRAAVLAADDLLARGYTPFVPHLNCFWDLLCPAKDDHQWLAWDKAWLLCCDALLRLPGVSPGADKEIVWAKEAGIPVFFSVDDLVKAL